MDVSRSDAPARPVATAGDRLLGELAAARRGSRPAATKPRGSRRRRRRLLVLLALVILACIGYAAARSAQAALAARSGKADLQRAAAALKAQHVGQARAAFAAAGRHFAAARHDLHAMGPLLPVSHVIPLARLQVRGLETMADVGSLLSASGMHLADAAGGLLTAQHAGKPLSQSLPQLHAVAIAMHGADAALQDAQSRTHTLDGYRLLGPLGHTRTALEAELARAAPQAAETDHGMRLLLWLIGVNGPHRVLVFSQNPDEVRPTGGFLGTYGILTGDRGHVALPSYGDILQWVAGHQDVGLPPSQSPNAFQFASPPEAQGIANVNASPDWEHASNLAMQFWSDAGGRPVDGVVSLEPQTLARVLAVLGPVQVPSYGVTVTAGNLVRKLDYYTHREAVRSQPGTVRKQFIDDLSHVVVQKVLAAPSSRWLDLGKAMAASFRSGEALIWSADPSVQRDITALGWSGAYPNQPGDFYADAEFEYGAKNGHALQRTFTHTVRLKADGSGTAMTTMRLRNTAPYARYYNVDSLSYITPYGPVGGTLTGADKPDSSEPSLWNHPSIGYLRAAQPLGSTKLTVGWHAPYLARPRTDGTLLYTLQFRGQPGHTGDILHLNVTPPAGWHWAGKSPPSTVHLAGTFNGSWLLRRD
jgi:hypothetical protein